jgi:hypothetical protein
VFKRAIAIVENANAIPKLGFLMYDECCVNRDNVEGSTFGSDRWYKACWYAEYACCKSSIMR